MEKRINIIQTWRFLHSFFLIVLLFLGAVGCKDPKKKELSGKAEAEVIYQDWPIFRRDPELQGESIEDLRVPLETAWIFKPETAETARREPIDATPVIANGVVYIGTMGGRFFAINLENGRQLWEFKAAGPVSGPAAVLGARVFFGDNTGVFYALNAEDGTEAWRYAETGDSISGGANLLESGDGVVRVFFGCDDYCLYCLNASTGEFLWKHETENKVVATPSLITSAGHPAVSFGGCDGSLHILSAEGKGEPRSVEIGSYITNSSCVRDGIAYIAHDGGEVVATVIETGEIAWRVKTGDEYRGAGAVGKDLLYIPGTKGKKLTAYRRVNGEVVWEFLGRRSFESSPVLTPSAIWQAGGDGTLYAIDPLTGAELWHWETGTKLKSSPAISRGTLVIAGDDGSVLAFRSAPSVPTAK